MTPARLGSDLVLVLAGFLAGALNSVAGGGSFLTFPALLLHGLPAVSANASSTLALVPGSFSATWAYRREFGKVSGIRPLPCLAAALAGGAVGALLLIRTPESSFEALLPWLLLFATLLFAFGNRLAARLKGRVRLGEGLVLALLFLGSVYGGYFGGGLGILMLSLMALLGMTDLHAMNALKTLLGGSLNALAALMFLASGAVDLRAALVTMAGAVAGGLTGASLARKVPMGSLRLFVVAVGLALTAVFFARFR